MVYTSATGVEQVIEPTLEKQQEGRCFSKVGSFP